jgi:uncharacterized protein YecT (DUF1311 family)
MPSLSNSKMRVVLMNKNIVMFALLLSNNAWSQDSYIQQMISTYNANQARFHQQYRNTAVKGVANVIDIQADVLGTGAIFLVHMNANGSLIQCTVYDKNVASALDKGQQVKYQGRVHDVLLGVLQVDGCRFASYVAPASHGSIPEEKPDPSFDCNKASNQVEQMICSDSGLSAKDKELVEWYISAVKVAKEYNDVDWGRELKETQVKFIKKRNACKTKPCILDVYEKRIHWFESKMNE